jgi:hypothetical protein
MLKTFSAIVSSCCFVSGVAFAQGFEGDLQSLTEASCIRCHDAETKTPLNMEKLDYDLANPDAFRRMVQIFDRIQSREMPPRSEPRPKRAMLEKTLASLKSALLEANLAARKNQRVSLRRLTRVEYEYTIQDLLGIHDGLGKYLASDLDSPRFDTIAEGQQISEIHVQSYLETANRALDSAILLGRRPRSDPHLIDYLNSPFVQHYIDVRWKDGGKRIRKLDDAVAMFAMGDFLRTAPRHSIDPSIERYGLSIVYPGLYRITIEAYAHQAYSPVTLLLRQKNDKEGGTRVIATFDLHHDESRTLEVITFLHQDDFLYPDPYDLNDGPDGTPLHLVEGYAENYKGEGIAIKSLTIQGPLVETWPPRSTRQLLTGVEFVEREAPEYPADERGLFDIKLTKEPIEHVADIVARLAPLAFRRPPDEGELESYTRLAEPAIAEGRDFADVIRAPLRAILSSPQLLFHVGGPGNLDDFALATRLSYFLWKSMPDEELFQLALYGMLSEPDVLEQQVNRMLDDKKSMRFVKDFVGQWLRLREIGATTPDKNLYPEYDDVLARAVPLETEFFFAELIAQDLSVKNFIDSEFTFLNRRLAKHYGIPGVWGQQMQKVTLSGDSLRGGFLTQASIHKITADGATTSPVRRGNFVVTNLLGQPPSPPPADVTIDEPDTRGTATIREQLDRHRDLETCANCHNHIDPPGFALESFDPTGRFRTRYRTPTGTGWTENLDVDASGITEDGEPFSGIQELKKLLLKQEDEVARHFISQLASYATGGEIQFSDRDLLSQIIDQTRDSGYPVRSIIHTIVQSDLFRSK